MKVVIEALPYVPFGGYAVARDGLLRGWDRLGTDDEVHVLVTEGVSFEAPSSIHVHRFGVGKPEALRRILVQSRAARSVCRDVGADVMLGLLPTTAVVPVGCPKVITVYDMRHELLPEQFSRSRRLLRKLSYGVGYRQAAAIICISERTRLDLLRSRRWLERTPSFAVHFGADHVDGWRREDPPPGGEPYALAFGHFPNKAVDRVVDAWGILAKRGAAQRLVFVGIPGHAREGVLERIREAGLEDLVSLLPWLDDDEFRARFASAGMIVFPSDFEGFGLPAIEAMRLGIPLVISDDEALLEVTGGNATIVRAMGPEPLADAAHAAWRTPSEELDRARAFAERYSWERAARETREILSDAARSG
jgi:glycosyltransferase involved in cell wall biosynthesis